MEVEGNQDIVPPRLLRKSLVAISGRVALISKT